MREVIRTAAKEVNADTKAVEAVAEEVEAVTEEFKVSADAFEDGQRPRSITLRRFSKSRKY
ncbi:hypothetical protein MMC10_004205 [Thelotrema lepadinum]|nr:hypothetical protein [Thelotrema lepadinum]